MITNWACPNCGNRNVNMMENNGLPVMHYAFTLLCRAPIADPDEESHPDGLCGFQWEPNDTESD